MPAEIVNMLDCASNYGVFDVVGKRGQHYRVEMYGSEQQPYCPCEGFKFRHECSHVSSLWQGKACLYNPQWHDGVAEPELRPIAYTTTTVETPCPACGGPTVPVRRAV